MDSIEKVAEEVRGCTLCALAKGRKLAVPGEGPANPPIMLIGEGPGFHENEQGRPFVGPAGKFLEALLGAIGFRRSEVFIANVVKCRPPNNRDPLPGEIGACDPYLQRQIELLDPKIIVTLGRYSMAKFFPGQTISRIHGQSRLRDGRHVIAMYHPAAALHNPRLRTVIEDDFKKVGDLLNQLESQVEPPVREEPNQLRLF